MNLPITKVRIPISKPLVGDTELQRVGAVLESGWLTQGADTFEFERQVAGYCGVAHGIATNSATTALHVALLLLGVGDGDEVIVPSYSHIATANAVAYTGAVPVFVDIKRNTYNLDEELLEPLITERTAAIMVVHQVGLPANLAQIGTIADEHGLKVVEDAACALGSEYRGRPIGGHANLAVLSFHPRKVITTGEGGMILTNDPLFASRARSLASHGEAVLDVDRHHATRPATEEFGELGFNYRLSNVQGAIGVAQMARLPEILEARRHAARRYCRLLDQVRGIEVPVEPEGCTPNYQSYMIRIARESRTTRDEVMMGLREAGIATRPGITAIHRQPAYRNAGLRAPLPETDRAVDETLILPLYPQLTEEEQDEVVERLTELVAVRT